MNIAIQGGKGSSNEEAFRVFASAHDFKNADIIYAITTQKVLECLHSGEAEYGIFAVKSSRHGAVQETQKALKKYSCTVVDCAVLPMNHCFFTLEEIDFTSPVTVISHPQALEEHTSFISKTFSLPVIQQETDTALAVKYLSQKKYPKNSVVIAPSICQEIYPVSVLFEPSKIPTNNGYNTTFHLVTL